MTSRVRALWVFVVFTLGACEPGAGVTDGVPIDPSGTASAGAHGLAERCGLTPEDGGCLGAFQKWAYDAERDRCVSWIWGGCAGVIPFDTQLECQVACEPCDQLLDVEHLAPAPRSIAIRNASDHPIYLRPFSPTPDGGFRDTAFEIVSRDEVLNTAPTHCELGSQCDGILEHGCPKPCTEDKPPPPPIKIMPFGTYPVEWDGTHLEPIELPVRCDPDGCADGAPVSCGFWATSEEITGDYGLVARAYVATALQCEMCECEPEPHGWCQLPASQAIEYGALVELSATLTYGLDVVELVYAGPVSP